MNNNIDNNRSRAKRRPEDLNRTSPQHNAGINRNAAGTVHPQSSQRRREDGQYYIPPQHAQKRSTRRVQNLTPVRSVTAINTVDNNKLIKAEEKRLKAERAEAEWQKDIVRVKGSIDVPLLAIILILLALGTITVFSASYPFAISKGMPSNYFIIRQLIFLGVGGFAMLVMAIMPIKWYNNRVVVILAYILSIAMLILVLFIGKSEGEATRWIRIGPVGIQPSELMKVALILGLAYYCSVKEQEMKELDFRVVSYKKNTLFPVLIIGIACFFILIGKHLSGTAITALIGLLMLIVAGGRIKWIIATVLPAGFVAVAIFLATNPYAWARITTFTNANADRYDEKYQTIQSMLAIGNGGMFGVGLGKSVQKYSYLSAAHTDFIFSVWCEEWGFVGAMVLIALFLLFAWRGYTIAIKAPNRFTMLTAFGITTQIILQAFLNICVASNIIMNTGISLPFFSYGGSSLVVLMAEMGILLAISKQSYKKKSELEHDELMKQAGIL